MMAKKTEKRCPHCRKWLSLEAFSVNRRYKSGRSSWCLKCARAATRRWRAKNAETYNARRRLGERERECVDCGATFTFKNAIAVRCPACRRLRKLEQARLRRAA
jgi:DNA-directed RNA polymerase subunit RPC12/RpoP